MFKPKVSIFVKVKHLFHYGKTMTCKPNLQHATCTLHPPPAINFFSAIFYLQGLLASLLDTPFPKAVKIDHAFDVTTLFPRALFFPSLEREKEETLLWSGQVCPKTWGSS